MSTLGAMGVVAISGWSPKLFHSMIQDGFDILTYRKGKGRLIHERRFVHRRAKLDGRWVSYDLHDQPVRLLKGKLRLRQVTRLCDNGHQTQVITNRWDLRDIEVAHRMFERWRQENFFDYSTLCTPADVIEFQRAADLNQRFFGLNGERALQLLAARLLCARSTARFCKPA